MLPTDESLRTNRWHWHGQICCRPISPTIAARRPWIRIHWHASSLNRAGPRWRKSRRCFGQNIVAPDGQLRRDELAQIVFTDPAARRKLESILHPRIRECWLAQVETWRKENHTLAVVVIPLLFETNAESHFDKTVCIACSAANQRRRLLERGWTPDQIQQRVAAQWPIGQKIARADFVIWTDGSLEVLAQQIERILCNGSLKLK